MLGAKEFLGALDGDALDLVGKLLAFVVTASGVSLGVFVGENRRGRFENGV